MDWWGSADLTTSAAVLQWPNSLASGPFGTIALLPGRQRQRERMRRVRLHVDHAQLVVHRLEADAAEGDGRRAAARREVLVHQARTGAVQLDQHRARAALPRQRDFHGVVLRQQREAIPLAR